jgi:hypothetical protein
MQWVQGVVRSTGKACGKEMKTKFEFALNLTSRAAWALRDDLIG